MVNRRESIKKATLAGAAITMAPIAEGASQLTKTENLLNTQGKGVNGSLVVPKNDGLKITSTFLDEISHDVPHQNWEGKEWDQDFKYMKAIGISTVIVIRCEHREFMTYPSEYLVKKHGRYMPFVDLIDMYLYLTDRYGTKFYFGLYDSGRYRDTGDMSWEIEDNKYVIDEVWKRYGHHRNFKGWYISTEISRQTKGVIPTFHTLGKQCKDASDGLPVFISPWVDGKEAVMNTQQLSRTQAVSVEGHEHEQNEIFDDIHDVVGACTFQDGHIDYDELDAFFSVNKKLADRYDIQCWTDAESFDRDTPIRFLPIKFDELRVRLEAVKRCHYDKVTTFKFSHSISPQSTYIRARHLHNCYKEYFSIR